MKHGLERCNSSYGNKGVIFTLDVTIAIFIVIIALATTTFYLTRLNQQTISDLSTLRFGSDRLTIMNHQGSLGYISVDAMSNLLDLLRGSSPYGVRIEIKCDSGLTWIIQGESSELGVAVARPVPPGKIPESGFVGSGKRIIIRNRQPPLDFCTARYWVWRK